MATIEQARKQLETSRQKIQQSERQIKEVSLDRLSRAKLQQRTRQDIIIRRLQQQQLAARKQEALKKLEPLKKELVVAERRVDKISTINKAKAKQVAEFNRDMQVAAKLFRKGRSIAGEKPRVQKFVRKLQLGEDLIREKATMVVVKDIPPTKLPPKLKLQLLRGRARIVFGQARKYGESYRRATGSSSFTIAIPIKRIDGKLKLQDYNFLYKDKKLVRMTPTGTAIVPEKVYREADTRRRMKNPEFIFGSTIPHTSNPPIKNPIKQIKKISRNISTIRNPINPFGLIKQPRKSSKNVSMNFFNLNKTRKKKGFIKWLP